MIEQLKEYRTKNNLSQRKLAQLLNVSEFTLNRWLNGKVKPGNAWQTLIKQFLDKT